MTRPPARRSPIAMVTAADPATDGVRRRLLGAAAALPLLPSAARAAETGALRFGIVPYLSTRQLLGVFDAVRRHVEEAVGQPVTTLTAPSLRQFGENVRDGRYDFAFMPPHFMRLAAQSWGHRIVAAVRAQPRAVIVKRKGTVLDFPGGLRGKTVVTLDALAITAMITVDWLREIGLEPGRDVDLRYLVTATSMLVAFDQPDVHALALIDSQFPDFTEERRALLEIAGEIRPFPPPGYTIAPGLEAKRAAAVREALLSFGGTAGGQGSLSRSALDAVDLQHSAPAERYARRLEAELARR